jgi:hypothetical protein
MVLFISHSNLLVVCVCVWMCLVSSMEAAEWRIIGWRRWKTRLIKGIKYGSRWCPWWVLAVYVDVHNLRMLSQVIGIQDDADPAGNPRKKLQLSMKYVNQSNGKDLVTWCIFPVLFSVFLVSLLRSLQDPDNTNAMADGSRRKSDRQLPKAMTMDEIITSTVCTRFARVPSR